MNNLYRNISKTLKNETYKANSNSVLYNSLKIELENKKTLLESLSSGRTKTAIP